MRSEQTASEKEVDRDSRYWLVGLIALSLVGLGFSVQLGVVHWRVHNVPGQESFCNISQRVNCDTVALSSYGELAGMPLSSWGALFYSLMLTLAAWGFFARTPPWPWALCGLLNALAIGLSAFLFLVSLWVVRSVCLMCLALYAVNLLSALVCILGQRRAALPTSSATGLPLVGLAVGTGVFCLDSVERLLQAWPFVSSLIGLPLAALVALNWKSGWSDFKAWFGAVRHNLALPFEKPLVGVGLCSLAAGILAATMVLTSRLYPHKESAIAGGIAELAYGTTPEGHCWIGADRPEVTIVEYSDYECSFCRQAHEIVRRLVRENKDWLRLLHVHMPLDHSCNSSLPRPFHRNACDCALAAICAAEQGAFWQMNDRLFIRRGGLDKGGLTVLAGNMGLDAEAFRTCLESDGAHRILEKNLAECRRLGLKPATPTFRVGSRVVMGLRDLRWWHRETTQLRERIDRSQPPPAGGRAKAPTKNGGADARPAGPGG